MNKSETITKLIDATIKVMEAVKGIDKSMTVGSGTNAYKGVPDQSVKEIIGEAMAKNGLAIFPIEIEENTQLNEWEDADSYNKGTMKRKQSVFTKVKTTYLLTHTSGEFITLQGYGHGVDSQDKSAGKATTYALKYTLLYLFLTPTGKIDDSDNTHSDELPSTKSTKQPTNQDLIRKAEAQTDQTLNNRKAPTEKPPITKKFATDAFVSKAVDRIKSGETDLLSKLTELYQFTEKQLESMQDAARLFFGEKQIN